MNEKRQRAHIPAKERRVLQRGNERPAEELHHGPAGVQGPNVGYWQAVGSTRAGAKRSKRP